MMVLLASMVFFLGSCGGKKKLTQRAEYSSEIAKVETVNEITQKDIETKKETNSAKKVEKVQESENFEAETSDPTKPASVKKTEKNGETVWEFENIKNFKTGNEKRSETTKDTLSETESKNDKSKTTKETKTDDSKKESGAIEIIDKKKDPSFPWWIIILIAIGYGVISYFRKTLNPLGWL